MNEPVFYELKGKDILHNIINLSQLVIEVTDACNLKCKYCAYGDMYQGYGDRLNSFFPFSKVKLIIDYLANVWTTNNQKGLNQETHISFYGGEPLLNMSLIKEVVAYVESLPEDVNKRFKFSMTTNGMLLDKYMDYLVKKNFQILISLDGDKRGHSYRVDHAGKNSFDRVYKNIKLLYNSYPEYFKSEVNFNSVLHNRNTVSGIYDFFQREFDKKGKISEITDVGINPEKIKKFNKIYRNKYENLNQSEDYEELADKLGKDNPDILDLFLFLTTYGKSVFENYGYLLSDTEKWPTLGTGTCLPFAKKNVCNCIW